MKYRRTWTNYEGLMPVPPHLWHLTILSPFLSVPFPSQFLHGFFFSPMLFRIRSSKFDRSNIPRRAPPQPTSQINKFSNAPAHNP
jgi:hypothetical protein